MPAQCHAAADRKPRSLVRTYAIVSMLTIPQTVSVSNREIHSEPRPSTASGLQSEKQNLLAAIILDRHQATRHCWRPLLCRFRRIFIFRLNQKVPSFNGQIFDSALIDDRAMNIKEEWLIIGSDRIKSLRFRNNSFDLRRDRFHFLPSLQTGNNCHRVNAQTDTSGYCDRGNNALSIFQRERFAAEPLWPTRRFGAQRRPEQPSERADQRHGITRQRSGNKIYNHQGKRD